MTLREQAFSGVRWTTLSALGRAVLQFAQIIILARLLSPADFGLMALVVAIMAFLQIFSDAGVSSAIIHHKFISQNQLSSLYWLNVTISMGLAFFITAVSGWTASLYQEPNLQYLLWLSGVVVVIGAVSQQLRVVAQKNLRFKILAKIELVSALIGFGVVLSAAHASAGVFSLILGALASAATSSAMAWGVLANGWRPCWRLQFGEIHQFLRFGGYMVGNNLANTFNSQFDVLLGGKLLGAPSIGLYSLPKDLNMRIAGLINPIVTLVGIPVMAKVQEDDILLQRVYLQTIRMTASLNFPIYIFLMVFASEVVHVLLGPEWVPTIPLLQILSIWALLRSTGNPVGALLMAKGRADLSFKWNLVWVVIMPPSIYSGSLFGVLGMALTMAGLGIISFWPNWYFLVRPMCGMKLGQYTFQFAVPLALSVISCGAGYFLAGHLGSSSIMRLVIGFLTAGGLYIGMCLIFNKVWIDSILELLALKIRKSHKK